MRILHILFFSNFIFCSLSFAQASYEVVGRVESNSGKPLSAVKVILIQESKQINMDVTDKSGRFQFKNVNAGDYSIRLLFFGFESKLIPINISNNTDLKTIVLSPKSKKIDEVVISTDRMTKASNIDKKEYSPSQLLSSQNASAAELINNLPSMNLGGEGNDLSFRGDEKIAIMINGKITALTGENLSQIPANSIEKIEVISVPGSKYNSDGSAGVINIILKNAKANFNGGYVLQSVGNNNKYNSQLGYNWSSAKWAINGAYNYTYNEFENCGNSERRYLDNVDLNAYNHISNGERIKRLHNLRIGADYNIDTMNTISVIGSLSKDWGSSFSSDNDTFRDNMMVVNQQWNLNNIEKDINTIYDINLAWSHLMSNKKDK
ncbi:MAG: TonB-dependent receptor, partial [Chitinophagales bacterium]